MSKFIPLGPPRYPALKRQDPHPMLTQLENRACQVSIRDYYSDIFEHLAFLETKNCPDPAMIDNQPELEWFMRPFLIDFLVELHGCFRLKQETLFLACSIADRYCSCRVVYRRHYQLVVTTSLWIAAKYQDKKSRTPVLHELVAMCRNIYEPHMFLQMEKHILDTLQWNVGSTVSVEDCLQLCLSCDAFQLPHDKDALHQSVAKVASFLCELSIYERDYMHFSASTKAISGMLLASHMLGDTRFPDFISKRLLDHENLTEDDMDFEDFDDVEFFFNGTGPAPAASQPHSLPFLQLTDSSAEDIRRCSLSYLNDIYKPKVLGKGLPQALRNKYKLYPVERVIEVFSARNMELYIQMRALVPEQALPLADHFLGLSVLKSTSYFGGESCQYMACKQSSRPTAAYPQATAVYGTGGLPTPASNGFPLPTSGAIPFRLSQQASEPGCCSPATPGSMGSGSVFSSSHSLSSVSSASSPLATQHGKPVPFRSTSQTYLQQQRVISRLNSTDSDIYG